MQELTELVNNTELNSMVIDVKEDIGDIMMPIDVDNEIAQSHMYDYVNPEQLMTTLEDNQIYPIARIVVFKDSRLAMDRPDLSYQNSDGTVWQNGSGESFVNPFLKEVWDYNVDIAIEAAKLGFKEIQFDYVRFPESFETLSADLTYNLGEYGDTETDEVQQRVNAVTDFVAYANEQLKSYDVDVSVDVFGYAATQREALGIGQNFSQIANNVDIISSMIYPSHWGAGAFDFATPDTEPYAVIDEYMKVENEVLGKLEDPPKSRPWIQDFTASYLGPGNYINYGAAEVEAQIQALKDNGVEEYLLWNAQNTYSEGTEYQ
ncbi:putative glycoside hydrolase [Jeotgalicoccus sp. WY2]|uniref:putative glycoside hydrolase n=1 Tax=Jeotgalicoccus sp. WY2 TaxID=2708346 RepID=UPI0035303697